MVETKGYTLEEIATAFGDSTTNLLEPSAYSIEATAGREDRTSGESSHKAQEVNEIKGF